MFDIGPCKIGIVICYDNQFPEIARVLALRGADVICMPHAARFKLWDDTRRARSRAAALQPRVSQEIRSCAPGENACFAVLTDQVGRGWLRE